MYLDREVDVIAKRLIRFRLTDYEIGNYNLHFGVLVYMVSVPLDEGNRSLFALWPIMPSAGNLAK